MLTGLWSQRCRVARMAECIQRPQRGIEISRHGDFCGSDSGQYCGALYLRGGGAQCLSFTPTLNRNQAPMPPSTLIPV